jgi:hypothetical protein
MPVFVMGAAHRPAGTLIFAKVISGTEEAGCYFAVLGYPPIVQKDGGFDAR